MTKLLNTLFQTSNAAGCGCGPNCRCGDACRCNANRQCDPSCTCAK